MCVCEREPNAGVDAVYPVVCLPAPGLQVSESRSRSKAEARKRRDASAQLLNNRKKPVPLTPAQPRLPASADRLDQRLNLCPCVHKRVHNTPDTTADAGTGKRSGERMHDRNSSSSSSRRRRRRHTSWHHQRKKSDEGLSTPATLCSPACSQCTAAATDAEGRHRALSAPLSPCIHDDDHEMNMDVMYAST